MKCLSIGILVVLLFLPLIRFSLSQGSYVGIQNGDEYEWELSLYTVNWNTFLTDDLGPTIENLMPLGTANLTRVFNDWSSLTAPQSYWPLRVTNIGVEETGVLFTSTPVNGTFGWIVPPYDNLEWDETWHIANDTSSFLQQTANLSCSFSPYAMFEVLFAPTTISWSSLIATFLAEMTSKGGLYANITATAQSNGFLIEIPAFGFENNSATINIDIKYNSKGVLSYYKFSYEGNTLISFVPGKYIPIYERVPDQYYFVFIGLAVILLVEIIFYIFLGKGRK